MTWHHLHSLVPYKWHRKADRGRSPVQKAAGPVGAVMVHPMKEHLASNHQESAPSTLVPTGGLSSPVPSDSQDGQCQVEELELPSTTDTFEAARDLIAMTAPQPPVVRDKPTAPLQLAPCRGNPAMMQRSSSPALAPLQIAIDKTLFFGTSRMTIPFPGTDEGASPIPGSERGLALDPQQRFPARAPRLRSPASSIRHRSPVQYHAVPPWSSQSRSVSLDSDSDSHYSHRSRHRSDKQWRGGATGMATPVAASSAMAFLDPLDLPSGPGVPFQGLPFSGLGAPTTPDSQGPTNGSEATLAQAPQPAQIAAEATLRHDPLQGQATATSAVVATEAPDAEQEEGRELVGQEDPVPPLASSSSSLGEALAGASTLGPLPIDHKAHQDLL
ncbi:uncharacterized protein [Lepidochelys kempii]|uniref:uncharacterized protein n=1 Tax=Lepidochelys kempii TaxID=8472 RepID=UPI003C6F9626